MPTPPITCTRPTTTFSTQPPANYCFATVACHRPPPQTFPDKQESSPLRLPRCRTQASRRLHIAPCRHTGAQWAGSQKNCAAACAACADVMGGGSATTRAAGAPSIIARSSCIMRNSDSLPSRAMHAAHVQQKHPASSRARASRAGHVQACLQHAGHARTELRPLPALFGTGPAVDDPCNYFNIAQKRGKSRIVTK